MSDYFMNQYYWIHLYLNYFNFAAKDFMVTVVVMIDINLHIIRNFTIVIINFKK